MGAFCWALLRQNRAKLAAKIKLLYLQQVDVFLLDQSKKGIFGH